MSINTFRVVTRLSFAGLVADTFAFDIPQALVFVGIKRRDRMIPSATRTLAAEVVPGAKIRILQGVKVLRTWDNT